MVAVLSEQVAKAFEEKTKIKVISLPPYDKLDAPVSSHADMLMCVIDNNIFFYKDYYQKNSVLFKGVSEKYNVILTEKECKSDYPYDIGLNVLVIGKKIFCNKKHTAKEILDYANTSGYEIIDVKQGYSACSTLVINDNCAITGDKGMQKALEKECIKTTLISPNKIALNGYNHGFIGGSVGVSQNKLYFFGEVENIDEFAQIFSILKREKCEYIPIFSGKVCDFGGIKFLESTKKI
ncbi:MAG: hypothetical protein IJ437_01150 [Clostridia bacterium]|nr:hypothetical protein [Clostridia bacterium]